MSGTLTYTIDGVSVSKAVVRQTLVNDDLSGNYLGVSYLIWGCPSDSFATTRATQGTISQSGTQFQFPETENEEKSCTWTGTWTQQGVLGRVDGTVSCIDGMNGTFAMSEVASSWLSVSGRVSANVMINRPSLASCTMVGTFALLR